MEKEEIEVWRKKEKKNVKMLFKMY